jgi:hypothetical protein
MNLEYIHDDYKLALDQWQRLTHAVRMGNREDCMDAIRHLDIHIQAMNSALQLHRFVVGLDRITKKKLRETP